MTYSKDLKGQDLVVNVGDGKAYRFWLQPNEARPIQFNFAQALPTGYSSAVIATTTYGIGAAFSAATFATDTATVYLNMASVASGTNGKITVVIKYTLALVPNLLIEGECQIHCVDQ
jgi:hypothetical protein